MAAVGLASGERPANVRRLGRILLLRVRLEEVAKEVAVQRKLLGLDSHEGRARRQRRAVHRSDRLRRGVVTSAAPAVAARVLGHPEAAVPQVALPPVRAGRLGVVVVAVVVAAVVVVVAAAAAAVAVAAAGGDDGSVQHDADLAGDVAVRGEGAGGERVAAHDGFGGSSTRRVGGSGARFVSTAISESEAALGEREGPMEEVRTQIVTQYTDTLMDFPVLRELEHVESPSSIQQYVL
jgi:hypothetical protein